MQAAGGSCTEIPDSSKRRQQRFIKEYMVKGFVLDDERLFYLYVKLCDKEE